MITSNNIDWDLINANKETNPAAVKQVKDKVIQRDIRKRVSADEEFAILRKTVKYILHIIRELHEGDLNIEEFMAHTEEIENIISAVDHEFEEVVK